MEREVHVGLRASLGATQPAHTSADGHLMVGSFCTFSSIGSTALPLAPAAAAATDTAAGRSSFQSASAAVASITVMKQKRTRL